MRKYALPTPCYLIDEARLEDNLRILKDVQVASGCKILLAQKCFSVFAEYPLLRRYLAGTTASGLFEAQLGASEFGGETHVYAPAYKDADFDILAKICDHISFNSMTQFEKYRSRLGKASAGLRINPECSTQDKAIYDPCAPGSRLGITRAQLPETLPPEIQGLHFHTLCEQDADALT